MKKPCGRGVTPRTRSLGGIGDLTEITHSHRGKRGGRGGNKNGRGRRPRLHVEQIYIRCISIRNAEEISLL